jgi:peptide/nickel transport system substrate-binding protein
MATGASAAAAAFLAACGGGDDGGSDVSDRDTSGLLNPITDTSKQRKRGGTFTFNNGSNRDPLHFDGKAQGQIQLNVFNSIAYEGLVRNKAGFKEPSTWSDVEPQLASGWEVSPDKLTITFKLRDGIKWHNKAPINGRAFTAEDVVVTWDKYENAETPNNKASNSNKVNPAAPILSMTAPDAKTVVVKLKEPSSYIFQRFASMITGELGSIYPREAGEGFDAKKDQIGTGAYILDRFEPSVGIYYKKNPDYWDKNAGWFDNVHVPLIPDYSAKLAQFKAGTLSTVVPSILAEDIIATKRDSSALQMVSGVAASNSPGASVRFGWAPIKGKPSPFLDIRARQAIALGFDRQAYIDTFFNVPKFESEGLPVDSYWFTAQGYIPEWTLDPRDQAKFGENARFFDYNIEEAKKLFAAAESAYGGSFPDFVAGRVNAVFGAAYNDQCEVMDQWARDVGFKVSAYPLDYNLDYLPKVVTQRGQFKIDDMGWAYAIGAVSSPDPTDYYIWRYYSKSGATSGSLGHGGPDGSRGDGSGDPDVDTLIEKAKAEFDSKKRLPIIHDLQRLLARQMYNVSQPGLAASFSLAWPAIQNWFVFQNDSRSVQQGIHALHELWYDSTKSHG